MTKIFFGTAGIPLSTTKPDTEAGIKRVKELGLEAMELEFVHGVKMKPEMAVEVKKTAEKEGIKLSVHAPYYINLNSVEEEKKKASRQRIIDSAVIGNIAGAETICFHPAYFQGMPKQKVFETVKKQLVEIAKELENKKNSVQIKPETTGKPTQFGSLEELLEIYSQTGIQPYIDFAHLHARENGKFKTKQDATKAIEEIEKTDSKLLKTLNIHMSGINYSEKGEKNHLMLEDRGNNFPYKWVLESLKELNAQGTIISESPDMEKDALLMKKYYSNLS